MALTKPKLSQNIDTDVSVFSDPILVLHQGSLLADVDVGFLMNRSNGLTSNAAVIWQESSKSFVHILTNSSGAANSNLTVQSYANVSVGNVLLINNSGIYVDGTLGSAGQVLASDGTKTYWAPPGGFTGGTVAGLTIFQSNLVVSNTTPSTNTTTGALVVAGGAGIAGNVYTNALYTSTGVYWSGNGQAFTSTTLANTTEITANLTSGQNVGLSLTATGVAAGNYGSATSIPTIVVDSKGRITSLTSNAVSTTINLAGGSGSGSVAGGGTLTINGTTDQLTTAVSASTITIAFAQDITAPGNLTVIGNLVVQGNTTTLNTETLTVEDLNITVANGAVTAAAADGAGLTVAGADARLLYKSATDSWVFNKGVFASGNLVANSGTVSSSVSTGALVVAGGIGVSGNVTFGGNTAIAGKLIVSDATDAVPYVMGSGAFHVAGGMSIGKDFWVGGNIYVANVISQTSTILQVSEPLVYLFPNSAVYNYDIGAFSEFSVGGIPRYTGIVRSVQSGEWVFFSNIDNKPTSGSVGISDPGVIYDPVKGGNIIAANTTPSTSTTTGALIVRGGAGIAGNVYANTYYTSNGIFWTGNGQAFTSTINLAGGSGSGSVTGGGTLTVNGTTDQINTTVSSSTITIALAGNLVTPGNLTVTGNLNVLGNTITIGSNNLTVVDSIIDLHSFANLQPHTVDDGRDIGIRFHYYKGIDDHAFLGWENDTQTLIYLQRSDEVNSNITGTFGNVQFGSLLLSNTTAATSTTTGALQVRGGVGISGNVFTAGWIIPTSNTSQNLGSTTQWWNEFYGVSTQARYADLAENYQADDSYEAGTVLIFGGANEVTISTISHDTSVAGVVSTNPAHLMNSALNGINVVPLALQGRVPCLVRGPVTKGTLLVSSDMPGVAQALDNKVYQPGCVIGKSLDTIADDSMQKIEVVIGRF